MSWKKAILELLIADHIEFAGRQPSPHVPHEFDLAFVRNRADRLVEVEPREVFSSAHSGVRVRVERVQKSPVSPQLFTVEPQDELLDHHEARPEHRIVEEQIRGQTEVHKLHLLIYSTTTCTTCTCSYIVLLVQVCTSSIQ